MTKTSKIERVAATVLAVAAGLGTAVDVYHAATFNWHGPPDVAIVLLLLCTAALHFGLTGANGGLAAVLGRRSVSAPARVLVWAWLVLSGVAVLLLSWFGAMLTT